MSDFGKFMETLDDDFSTTPVKAEKPAETFPCQSCAGTGIWKGFKRNGYGGEAVSGKCFSCNGVGSFKKSYADRKAAKDKRVARKAAVVSSAKAEMIKDHAVMLVALHDIASWHRFAASLVEQYRAKGDLSEKQIAAAYNVIESVEKKAAERSEKRDEKSGTVDMARIREMFETASGGGLKRPVFRTQTLKLSLAPATGNNPGAIYVKYNDAYAGKIVGDEFKANSFAPADTLAQLIEIAADPLGVAVKYGRVTGSCGCCGRELTVKESVERGIGPICAEKWGF